ncbi:MAG: hypothetical protein ACKVII_19190 [Planctomycetales bacterium]
MSRSSTFGPFPGERGELPLTAIRFRDGHTTHRTRPVRPIEKLLHDGLPLRACPFNELGDRDPVRTGGPAVTTHPNPCSLHIGTGHNRFHQHLWKYTTYRRVAAQGWLLERRRPGSSRSGY